MAIKWMWGILNFPGFPSPSLWIFEGWNTWRIEIWILGCQSISTRIQECLVQNSESCGKNKKKIFIKSHWYLHVTFPHIKTYSILTLKICLGIFLKTCRRAYLPEYVFSNPLLAEIEDKELWMEQWLSTQSP